MSAPPPATPRHSAVSGAAAQRRTSAASRAASPVNKVLLHPATKVLVFLACLWPVADLAWGVVQNTLGANPAEALIRSLGEWGLRFLCLTLAVTPVRQLTAWHALARYRRMLGLYTFFYACLHLVAYAWLDMGFYVQELAFDIVQRPFILVGFLTWLLMLPLALTSMNRAVRKLGARRWQQLHRLVYVCALLAVLHFLWMRSGKNDYADVYVYGAILGTLLAWRVWHALRTRRVARAAGHPS